MANLRNLIKKVIEKIWESIIIFANYIKEVTKKYTLRSVKEYGYGRVLFIKNRIIKVIGLNQSKFGENIRVIVKRISEMAGYGIYKGKARRKVWFYCFVCVYIFNIFLMAEVVCEDRTFETYVIYCMNPFEEFIRIEIIIDKIEPITEAIEKAIDKIELIKEEIERKEEANQKLLNRQPLQPVPESITLNDKWEKNCMMKNGTKLRTNPLESVSDYIFGPMIIKRDITINNNNIDKNSNKNYNVNTMFIPTSANGNGNGNNGNGNGNNGNGNGNNGDANGKKGGNFPTFLNTEELLERIEEKIKKVKEHIRKNEQTEIIFEIKNLNVTIELLTKKFILTIQCQMNFMIINSTNESIRDLNKKLTKLNIMSQIKSININNNINSDSKNKENNNENEKIT
uniref:hypothetical protein n=1 Tax=Dictyostelium intermedium TaxID=361076 RepID=UPI001D126783|nr:hypothetical protein LKZ32_mgp12 [Dictyostelium intermedium]DAZ85384.1 TPA_asm: hypothetical protein [Dictyostelium intermedium]